MTLKSPRWIPKGTSFTLVEMMVAMAVLSLILVVLATATATVSRIWLNGIGAVDNFTKARLALSLLDRDIQLMVLRRDLAAFTDSTGTQSQCAFYTMIEGYPAVDTRCVSLVQYSMSQLPTPASATSSVLQRLNYGMNYATSSSAMTPEVGYSTNLVQLASPVVTAHAVTESVFTGIIQFQIQFVDGTGTILNPPYSSLSSTPPSSSTVPTLPTPFWFDYANPGGTYNPRTVVVSMVVLSNPAYIAATQSGGAYLSTVIGCFSTSPPSNETYSQVWNAFLAAPNSTFLSLPPTIRGGVQVFERNIPLPITTPSG